MLDEQIGLICCPESVHLNKEEHMKVQKKSLAYSKAKENLFSLVDFKETEEKKDSLKNDVKQGINLEKIKSSHVTIPIQRYYNSTQTQVTYPFSELELHPKFAEYKTITGELVDKKGYLLHNRKNEIKKGYLIVKKENNEEILVDEKGYQIDKTEQRLSRKAPYGIFTDKTRSKYIDILSQETKPYSNERINAKQYTVITRTQQLIMETIDYIDSYNGRYSSRIIFDKVLKILSNNTYILPRSGVIAGMISQQDIDVDELKRLIDTEEIAYNN